MMHDKINLCISGPESTQASAKSDKLHKLLRSCGLWFDLKAMLVNHCTLFLFSFLFKSQKLPNIESLKRQKSEDWNCSLIPYEITKIEAIDFALDRDNVLYLDLKELVTKLIEYGVRDDELFTTGMIPLEES